MLAPTPITWILVIFGALIYLPVVYGQIMLAARPRSQKTRDIVIGKGEDWRDKSHFRSSYGIAWADIILQFPLMIAGSIGTLLGQTWGYVFLAAVAAIAVWGSIVLWFSEKEYVYPSWGSLAYYTFVWGFFVYWGLAAGAYAVLRLSGVMF
jgi:hypothetical protein